MDQPQEFLTRRQRRALARQERQGQVQSVQKRRNMRKGVVIVLSALVVLAGIGGIVIAARNVKPSAPGDVLSTNGIHWHPQLTIGIKGVNQEIPTDIGLGAFENPIHTHDATGTIHLEFSGRVTREDTKLSKFFDVWKKTFTPTCILDQCNSPDGTVKFTVNGQPNTEYGDYEMHDGDKIEIRYE